MSVIALANPTIIVNNLHIAVVPNETVYTEGFGEQKMRVRTGGGGNIESVYSNDVETNLSMLKFHIYSTIDYLELARGWKALLNANLISITDDNFSRHLIDAALTNNYEVGLGASTTVELEWHGIIV